MIIITTITFISVRLIVGDNTVRGATAIASSASVTIRFMVPLLMLILLLMLSVLV